MTFFNKNILPVLLPLLLGCLFSAILTRKPAISDWLILVCSVLLILILIYWAIVRLSNKIIPRRFANLIYALDENDNMAIIFHPFYQKYQPPGSRLGPFESPHSAVHRVMKEELGLEKDQYQLISDAKLLKKYGNTQFVHRPYLVKSEFINHRLGVKEHYDFVYVCKVKGIKPILKSNLQPNWMNMEGLKALREGDISKAPWSDVIPTYQSVLINKEQLHP